MSKINDKNELYNYKAKTADHAKHHPGWSKLSFRDKESSNYASNYKEILDAPEAEIKKT